MDPGAFADLVVPVGESLLFKAGTRVDEVWTNVEHTPPLSSDLALTSALGSTTFDREFPLYAAYATAEYQVVQHWRLSGGFGTAEVAPTPTELYAAGPFIAVVQNGLTSAFGNPVLRPQRVYPTDVGMRA